MDFKYLVTDARAKVYLWWAILVPLGFVATHFYQRSEINILWALIAVAGLSYMWQQMPLKNDARMRRIFAVWAAVVGAGMAVSFAVFYLHTPWAADLSGYLGAFWLGVMAAGYALNGLVDAPSAWYWVAAALNAVACVLCFTLTPFVLGQFLIAAIVSAWSLANLWLFRAEFS